MKKLIVKSLSEACHMISSFLVGEGARIWANAHGLKTACDPVKQVQKVILMVIVETVQNEDQYFSKKLNFCYVSS